MIVNQQPVEKTDFRTDGSLDIHSIFYTIQGEGPYTGYPAVFIRLAGCNLQCPGCDTEYTATRQRMAVSEVINKVVLVLRDSPHPLHQMPMAVITGGEPFRQDLTLLCSQLQALGMGVQIETNGVLGPSPGMIGRLREGVVVVVSPKTSRIHEDWGRYADAFKYVLQDGNVVEEDLLPRQALMHKATPHVARPPVDFCGPVYVNPMDEKDPARNQANLELVKRAALTHGYIAGVQMHKIMSLE